LGAIDFIHERAYKNQLDIYILETFVNIYVYNIEILILIS